MWFAAMSTCDEERWMGALVDKLLRGDRSVAPLFAHDAFADAPTRRRASCAPSSIATSSRRAGPRHGGRTRGGESMRPMAKEDPDLEAFLRQNGLRRR